MPRVRTVLLLVLVSLALGAPTPAGISAPLAEREPGALLERVRDEFDVFITMDSNIVHQQNLDGLKTCLVVLHAVNSRYETLQPLLPQIKDAISKAASGSVFLIKD